MREKVQGNDADGNGEKGAILHLVSRRPLQDETPCDRNDVGNKPKALAEKEVTANGNLSNDGEREDEIVNVLPHGTTSLCVRVSLHCKDSMYP